jgi:hypothetical protein
MARSRSAKEICRDFGENDISCRVAKDQERRQAARSDVEAPAPVEPPPPPPPSPVEDNGGFFGLFGGRREQIERRIREGGG